MTNEERYYFRDYIPQAFECPCYVKSIITIKPIKLGIKINDKLSLCISKECKWHKNKENKKK